MTIGITMKSKQKSIEMKRITFIIISFVGICSHSAAQIWQPDIFGYYARLMPDTLPLWELPTSEWMNVTAHFKSGDGSTGPGILEAEYYDGLGRSWEKVTGSAGGQSQNHVFYQEYDDTGRKGNVWLPAVFPSDFVSFHPYAQVSQSAQANNGQDTRPYDSPVYEDNALDRIVEQYSAGADWYNHGKSVRKRFLANVAGNDSLGCLMFSFSYSGPSISIVGSYADNTLQVTGITDEDEHRSYEFRDRQGRLVLTRRMMDFGEGSLDTYYLYDGLGNLCVVIPPALSAKVVATGNVSGTLPSKYAYLYRYDNMNRLVCKKMPGGSPVYMAYDAADRLIFIQDGVQRTKGKATFFLYDVFGRECVSGECQKTLDATGTASVSAYAHCEFTGQGNLLGYETSAVTLNNPVVMSANYYDNYDFIGDDSLRYVTDANAELMPPKPTGLLTGTATRLLRTGTSSVYEYTAFYYDEYNRVIQQRSTNHFGGYDHHYKSYDFMGNLISDHHEHSSSHTSMVEQTNYTYDNQNRLLTCTHSLNEQPAVTLVNNEYDALGRLSVNRRNGNAMLKSEYSYNVRSWISGIGSPLFTENLFYNTTDPSAQATPCYGGNVSSLGWQSADSVARSYSFIYDQASRLTDADYRENGASSTKYQTSYAYDENGNITSLQRYGRYVNDWRLVDDLSYNYSGNQLQSVSKTGVSPRYYGAMYFQDGATANTEYEYDENGRLTKDLNRKISSIQYNSLNLPTKIEMTNNSTISYTFTTGGEKRRTVTFTPYEVPVINPFLDSLVFEPGDPAPFPGLHGTGATVQGGVIVPRDPTKTGSFDTLTYCGNFIYHNSTLERVLFDGGYVTMDSGQPHYHFYIRDHLGNNRLVLSAAGQVEQVNDYYPFGALTYECTNGNKQPYKFNGKELQRSAGIDWYDYGARHYDPVLCRFTTMDPLCEKYYDTSPYAYCLNNPVNAVDPDGKSTWVIYQGNGKYQIVGGSVNDKDRNIYSGYYNKDNQFVRLHSIGITTSITSFYNSDINGGQWQKGSIINVKDKSGTEFLSSIVNNNPPMFDDYMVKARNGQYYDFKVTNGNGKQYNANMFYRGMPIGKNGRGQTIFSSARDIGNIAAGYIAAANGMSWDASRLAFDTYQSKVDGKLSIEGTSTRNAEYIGWKMGYNNTTNSQKVNNFLESLGSFFNSAIDALFKW